MAPYTDSADDVLRRWAAENQARARSAPPHVWGDEHQQQRGHEPRMHVTREQRTYSPDSDPRGVTFLRDVARQFLMRDPEAEQRLVRHMAEERTERGKYLERANAGTGNFAGLVVPQYLTDMFAPAIAAGRPFADICNGHELPPDGMTINVPLLTTATSVALQSAENAAGSSTAPNDTLLTENVQTATGNVTVSRQAIDRGTGIDEVLAEDLFSRYATSLDSTLINQAATGLNALASVVTFTSGTPSGSALYTKILGAAASVEAALLQQGTPTHVLFQSSRWWWIASQLSASWPLINTMGPAYPFSGGVMNPESSYGKGPRGVLPSGLLAVADNNIPTNLGAGTNQDRVFVVARRECHLWETPGSPVFIRADQPAAASLGVQLVTFSYFAYTFRRYPGAVACVDGTGLTTPAF